MNGLIVLLATLGQVDMTLTPLWQHVLVDDVAQVALVISSDAPASVAAVDVILSWDPGQLELLSAVPGPGGWLATGFLNDPDDINADLTDGDALYTALASPFSPLSLPPDVLVATFHFRVLGDAMVSMLPALGTFGESQVVGTVPGQIITGDLSGPVFITTVPGTWADLGGGIPGIQGVPLLVGEGPLRAYSPLTLSLTQAPPSGFVLLWISLESVPVNYFGGTLHAVPFFEQLLLVTDPAGALEGSVLFPPFVPGGTQIWFQYLCQDFSVIQEITFSNAVRATTP